MARDDLSQNQIVPAARPVGAFIQPARPNVAAPAQPQMLPNPAGIRTIGQGSGGNVGGFNQFAELAEALAPFSRSLIQLAGTGMQLYASQEYERGESEIARAQVLANQQMLQSQGQYARDNRKLAQADPIAAVMMDRVNPFREAGRQNRAARIAAAEVLPAVMTRYRSTPGGQKLRPGSPELKQIEAQAVAEVVNRYGLNQSSPGFIEHVLPQIGQASQRLVETHYDDYTKYQKRTAWRQAAEEGFRLYQQAREAGVVEWTEYTVSGSPRKYTAKLSEDRAAFERGVSVLISQIAERMADETGIPGETAELREQMIVRLAEMASMTGSSELERILIGVEVGPPGKDGRRSLAGSLYGIEMLKGSYQIEQMKWQSQQQRNEQLIQGFESDLAGATYGLPDGPERGQKIRELVDRYRQMGVPVGTLMESVQGMSKTLDEVAARSYSPAGMDALLQDFQARVGTGWNAQQADRQFESMLSTVPPQDRAKYREQYATVRRRQEQEKDDIPLQLVNPLLTAKIKSNLLSYYPQDVNEAALRGADIVQMMAWGDADVARSAQLQRLAYMKHVSARLREAAAKKGAKLDAGEVTAVVGQALEEYGSKNKEALEGLFPGSDKSDVPSVSGRARAPSGGSAAAPSKPAPVVYPSGQLDNIPNRSQRLQSGEAVLALPSVQEEIQRVLNGQPPSAAVRRAARDAGYGSKVGEWLLRQRDLYPGAERSIPLDARRQLLRSSRDAQGAGDALVASAGVSRPVQQQGSWFIDALLGIRPASASTRIPWERGGAAPDGASGSPASAFGGRTLGVLATGRMVAAPPGRCVTAVLESMAANGLPNPAATGSDPGNNPRGLASQLVNGYGWKPLPGIGSPRVLNSPYGRFTANVMSAGQYQAAVEAGQIPSGALVFQTRNDWNGSADRSRGFDVAIARNGGRNLWNGQLNGSLIYGNTKQVFVLLPGDAAGSSTPITRR